jgi:uncharacterized protein YjbI with pentapeptide repeats
MASEHPDWARCSHDGCTGVRLPTTSLCLAHAVEQAPGAFDAELQRIGAGGTVDARGVVITTELLGRLLAVLRPTLDQLALRAQFEGATFPDEVVFERVAFQRGTRFEGARFFGRAGFEGVTFFDGARFEGVTFHGEAEFGRAHFHRGAGFGRATFECRAGFDGATFQGRADFDAVTFQGRADFNRVTFGAEAEFVQVKFQDLAEFDQANFQDRADFLQATFQRQAGFGNVVFQGRAGFEGVTFQDGTWFVGATFQGWAEFTQTTFQKWAGFIGASFQRGVGFRGATVQGWARFDRSTFERASEIGPLLARQFFLDEAVFAQHVQLEVTAAAVCARRAHFRAGVRLRLRYASVLLDDADLGAPAILAGVPSPFSGLEGQERQIASGWQRLSPGPRAQRWRPRLVSVRRADVADLRLTDVDLRACRFAGAHNLDRLRIEGAPLFAHTTGWWRARRKTLAEEQHWRAHRPGRWRTAGWYPQPCQPPASPEAEAPGVLEPARLAALYRELRKGREDAKDEPGAADFYYGEMELRRHDPATPRAERLVLWLYWLLSGYALRAWRALAALAVVVVLAGVVLAFWGFPATTPTFRPAGVDRSGTLVYQQQPAQPPAGLGRLPDAIRFSARSATALLRGPDRALTPLGEWLEIGLRFAGPVLLGLAVLSVRGRVRR